MCIRDRYPTEDGAPKIVLAEYVRATRHNRKQAIRMSPPNMASIIPNASNSFKRGICLRRRRRQVNRNQKEKQIAKEIIDIGFKSIDRTSL